MIYQNMLFSYVLIWKRASIQGEFLLIGTHFPIHLNGKMCPYIAMFSTATRTVAKLHSLQDL